MNLPEPKDFASIPHWRVNIRPEIYEPDLIPSLAGAFELVEQSNIRLRGWYYPHVSRHENQRAFGNNWIASGANSRDKIEYWRLFQSAQFIHLFAVYEASNRAFREHLEQNLKGHLGSEGRNINWAGVSGYISIVNLLYTVTEIFEFASRLAQRGIYKGQISISIQMKGVKGFALSTDWNRAWWGMYQAGEGTLGRVWKVSSPALAAESPKFSLSASRWFFERFGWIEQSGEVLKDDQAKLLRGLL